MFGQFTRSAALLLGLAIVFAGSPAQAAGQETPVPGRSPTQEVSGDVMGIHVRAHSRRSDRSTAVTSARLRTGDRSTGFASRPLTGGEVSTQATSASYVCVKKTTSDSNLVAYRPLYIDLSNSEWEVHYTNHPYSMSYARYVSGTWTAQFEQCVIGGSRNKTWHRLANTESEVSIGAAVNRRIGAKWGTGVDDGEVSSSIDFSVSAAKAVTIAASLPMTTGGSFQGGLGDGLCGSVGNHSGNQVNASWDFTYPGFGTAKFKGNVGHALYEFPRADKASFTVDWQVCIRSRY